MADTLCTKCRNPECEYAGRKVWVMICAHEYVAPPMTHGDQLRAKNDEELAWAYAYRLASCYGCEASTIEDCVKCTLDWLRQEVKE